MDVRLNTNESPFPPPAGFVSQLGSQLADIEWNRYPDRTARTLRDGIAARHNLSPGQVFVANGSNEVLQTLALTYSGTGRTVACFEPGYQMHTQIARIVGATVATLNREEDFSLDPVKVRSFLAEAKPSIVFLTSPNNPTGRSEPPSILDTILDSTDALVVVDEAYAEFGNWSAADRIDDGVPLVVSRTFSKTWSMAASRLGYLLGPEALIENLWNTVLPYHLDAVTQLAGCIALDFVDEMSERVRRITDERSRVENGMIELGLNVVPSDANFVLFSSGARSGSQLWQALLDRSVLVRDCSGWPRLEGWLRVTIGTPEENTRFLEALKEINNG